MTDRWFPSQCLRPTPPTGSGQTHGCCLGSWPKSSTSGHSPRWAGGGAGAGAGRAVPSSGSSNTRLEKQLFPSAHTTAPTRAIPVGRESSPWHNWERAVAPRPQGMSHTGPLGVVAPQVPRGPGGCWRQLPGVRGCKFSPRAPRAELPDSGHWGEMTGRSLAEVQESGRRHQSSPGTC